MSASPSLTGADDFCCLTVRGLILNAIGLSATLREQPVTLALAFGPRYANGHATRTTCNLGLGLWATLREWPRYANNLGLGLWATLREWPRYANNLQPSTFPTATPWANNLKKKWINSSNIHRNLIYF
ncbi:MULTISPECIES: hypothetical protein [unclassified Moorena]|uniref:hypothetical protein n=1 Tax=unclassified Moorena TaxID=2683338 RepID=UPI0013C04A85|nr:MULTISPECIES: hypothetical protein [unclassified Moorena]NEO09916.1 hypothetical protein [Moorena sp. SIO3I8]NEP22968.1 hypothetical protein [Moorena sp. SIO3I6]